MPEQDQGRASVGTVRENAGCTTSGTREGQGQGETGHETTLIVQVVQK